MSDPPRTPALRPQGDVRAAPRIVVAEDDRSMRELIGLTLEKHGYVVSLAGDGESALHQIESLQKSGDAVALLITDLSMPRLGGLALMAKLASSPCPVPFILISSFMSPEHRAEAERLGAAAVFSKPFDLAQLVAAVGRIVPGETRTGSG